MAGKIIAATARWMKNNRKVLQIQCELLGKLSTSISS